MEEKLGRFLILRFVLLYVTLKLWSVITSAFTFLAGGIFLGVRKLSKESMIDDSWVMWGFYLLSNIPQVVTWLLILGIGWPLFKDLNDYLNVDMKKLLYPWKK